MYEYKTVSYNAKGILGGKVDAYEFELMLNQLGAEGWELVSSLASNTTHGQTSYIISIFKRMID